ncbi:invasion associated locus B family protein [Phaeovulum sp. W22_SRMD_FR3]|uniref:invasion associated locus B family protein n=1 Tax=Phaeovulum sp. W22_SRMD_FR3 TaxID=3240274 RepID=UPI003F96C3F3
MTLLTKSLAIVALMGMSLPALAQDSTPATPAPAADATAPAATTDAPAAPAAGVDALSMGAEATPGPDAVGSEYVAATQGDWEQRCVRTEDGKDPCQLYQLLKDGDGNHVAEISIFPLPAGQPAAAGATIITPLETLLTEQVAIQVDTATAKVYPFTVCARVGCISRVGFTAAEIEGFRKGNKATISIVPAAAPDKKVELAMSLKGFTAGYEAVSTANAAAQK